MYEINSVIKSAEQDDYERGCIGGDGIDLHIDMRFAANTLEETITQFANAFGVKASDVGRDVCEEVGRVEVSITETGDGNEATPAETERWKRGELVLYSATYTGYVEEVTRRPVSAKTP